MGKRKKRFYWIVEGVGIPIPNYNRQSPTHKLLVQYAFNKMRTENYSNIRFEHILAKGHKIDLTAQKGGKLYGIECTTQHDLNTKKKKYSPYVDKLIFCIPERKRKIKLRVTKWEVPLYYFHSGIIE